MPLFSRVKKTPCFNEHIVICSFILCLFPAPVNPPAKVIAPSRGMCIFKTARLL